MKLLREPVTQQELSKLLGITARQIRDLTGPVFTKTGDGKYDVDRSFQAYLEYREAIIKAKTGTKLAEETRLIKVKADREEIAYRKDVLELIPADKIGAAWESLFLSVRSKILAIASNVKTRCPGIKIDVVDLIESECRNALAEAADSELPGGYCLSDEKSALDIKASAKTKIKRMGGRKGVSKSRIKRKLR